MGSQNSFDEIVKNRFENWEPASGDIISWSVVKSGIAQSVIQTGGIVGPTLKFLSLTGVVSASVVAFLLTSGSEEQPKLVEATSIPPLALPLDQEENEEVVATPTLKEPGQVPLASLDEEIAIDQKGEWFLEKKSMEPDPNPEPVFPLIESKSVPIIPQYKKIPASISFEYSPSLLSGSIHPNLTDDTYLIGLSGPGRFSQDRVGHSFNLQIEGLVRPWLQVTYGLILYQNNLTIDFLKRGDQTGAVGSTQDSAYQVNPTFGTVPGTFSSETLLFGPNTSIAILLNRKSPVIHKVGIGFAFLGTIRGSQSMDHQKSIDPISKPNAAFNLDYHFLIPLKNGFFIEAGPCYTHFSNRINAGLFTSQTQSLGLKIGISKEL